ncbi:ATP-dependent DNA helicase Snf21 [Basidiobolus ranarum]|uniref:ATP-dependent DNA helicase Snf21 n=1 Tax=Basidiobolus ranarum TaxID=34480 RepID=A0ABR2VY23_9FUNG
MDEELNDDDLNEIIARSDEELRIFKQMDVEKDREAEDAWRRAGGRGKKPERLIQEYELPEIYLRDHMEDLRKQRDTENHGRGHRARGDIRYDDGLTEEQWLEAIEDDNVDLTELIAERNRRRGNSLGDDDGEVDTDASDTKPLPPRKRGRAKRDDLYDDGASVTSNDPPRRGRPKKKSLDEDVSRKKRKTKDPYGPDPHPPHIREAMTQIFQQLYDVVEQCVDPEDDNRQRCLLFNELPSKKIYPQYYIMIQQPIALNIIKKRMKTSYYKTILQFRDDFHLMFNNARTFNEEGSWVYVDAEKMQEAFDAKFAELCPNGNLPGYSDNNADSLGQTNSPKKLPDATTDIPTQMNYDGSKEPDRTYIPDNNSSRQTFYPPSNAVQSTDRNTSEQFASIPVASFSNTPSGTASHPANHIGDSQSLHMRPDNHYPPGNLPPYNNFHMNNPAPNPGAYGVSNFGGNSTPNPSTATPNAFGAQPQRWRAMDDDDYDRA